MIKIGITGQAGFIGTHLYNTLGLYPDQFIRIPFEDKYFEESSKMEDFVSQCDVIVHLAAINRHEDLTVLYNSNIKLAKQLINAMENTNSRPNLLFSSSTQEERDNLYGKSKKECRILFESWAKKNMAKFTGLIIPNVFGPFGKPYYNSVIATFCHQLTHNEIPKIEIDSVVKSIYVGELVDQIIDHIHLIQNANPKELYIFCVHVNHTSQQKVSALLNILQNYQSNYLEKGMMPALNTAFDKQLFNTFLCYIDHSKFFPFFLSKHEDNRGTFVETIKLNSGGQISFSTTNPGITRGNHFHTHKTERFAVTGKIRHLLICQFGILIISEILDKMFSIQFSG
jgi:UDP-2-acetamido-2,6-beta-L-arabino-hexul-4-ose reductase